MIEAWPRWAIPAAVGLLPVEMRETRESSRVWVPDSRLLKTSGTPRPDKLPASEKDCEQAFAAAIAESVCVGDPTKHALLDIAPSAPIARHPCTVIKVHFGSPGKLGSLHGEGQLGSYLKSVLLHSSRSHYRKVLQTCWRCEFRNGG